MTDEIKTLWRRNFSEPPTHDWSDRKSVCYNRLAKTFDADGVRIKYAIRINTNTGAAVHLYDGEIVADRYPAPLVVEYDKPEVVVKRKLIIGG